MDLIKAQKLLNKIQAFLDDGNDHELSRLEKDLLKTYVQQLYDIVISDEPVAVKEKEKTPDIIAHKVFKQEPVVPKTEMHKEQIEIPKIETAKPHFSEQKPPVPKHEDHPHREYMPTPPKQKPVEPEVTVPEVKSSPAVPEIKHQEHTVPVKESTPSPKHTMHHDQHDELVKLFDLQKSDEMGSRFGHVPIASIESAMGLNERIFTLNELFGGDKGLFDAWCDKLNSLHSYNEAKNVLIEGPAKDFKWADPERIKMAQQFIRIVARRYPKTPA